MARPQARIVTTTTSALVATNSGYPRLTFGTTVQTNTVGINFNATLSLPPGFVGDTEWVQVVTVEQATRQRASDLKYDHHNGFGLDTQFPYPNDPPSNPLHTDDTPDWNLTNGYIEYNVLSQDFEMWLLFRPAGDPTHWVPLRAVNWGWGGSATNTGGVWLLEAGSGTNTVNPTDFDTLVYPQWTNNITNFNNWILAP